MRIKEMLENEQLVMVIHLDANIGSDSRYGYTISTAAMSIAS